MNRRAKMKLVAGLAKNLKTLPTAMALARKLAPKSKGSKRSAVSASLPAARPSKPSGTKETSRAKSPTLSKVTDSTRL
ncbi:MAG: hypothetical protein Q7R47_02640, partial [Candidatus Diapherotrites archaeon]|nr:hypothetical protein [Candidatus Diapherotrites archaeon]